MTVFENRKQAAKELSKSLQKYAGRKDAIILAIPRGALELGEVLRKELKLPLDIVVTKKIGAPGNPELAIGVVNPEGEFTFRQDYLTIYGIPHSYVQKEAERLKALIGKRYTDYRGDASPPSVEGKICILVDDGIATGHTIRAAVRYLKHQKAKKIVIAVPVASADSATELEGEVDELICLERADDFYAVSQFYKHFDEVSDEEAIRFLAFNKP